MQNNTNPTDLFAVRYPELVTRLGFFTAEQLTELFGVDSAELLANPAAVDGITETLIDLSEDGKTQRIAVRAMAPSILEVGAAMAYGWPAVFIAEDSLHSFLTDAYELPADWQPTAAGVAELVDVLLADAELMAESGIAFADGWKITQVAATGGSVTFTIEQDGHLPVTTDAVDERSLIRLVKGNGVKAAVAALRYLAVEVNKRAAHEVYAAADKQSIVTALAGGAIDAQPAAGVSFDRLAEILRGDAAMENDEADALIELVRMQANS